jgi:hypothetical protein
MAGKCIHCLRLSERLTYDHGFPSSWYPDSTPRNVQRWTAPSCPRCNNELGRLERDFFIRTVLCIDPRKEAVAGLAGKALRSLGLRAGELSDLDRSHRERLGAKFRAELMPFSDVAKGPGVVPGLGPYENSPWAVPIPWASLAIIAGKITRVCEHRLGGRFVEPPYGIRSSVDTSGGVLPDVLLPFAKVFDFGPGLRIARLSAVDDPLFVRYWISIWDTLHLRVYIDLEDALHTFDTETSKVEGILPEEGRPAMRISHYLREMR